MKIWTLHDAFRQEISRLSDAIAQFLEVHEELADCATDPALGRLVWRHLKQTEQQAMNLDRIAELLSEQDMTETNHAARGIAHAVRDSVDAAQMPQVRDWVIAMAVDTIAHTEVTRYTALLAMAEHLDGLPAQVEELLRQNLAQEEQTGRDLEQIAPQVLRACQVAQ